MKKLSIIILSLVAIGLLSACSFMPEKEKVFYLEEVDGSYSYETFTYKGDKVLKQVSENFLYYDAVGLLDEADAKEITAEIIAEASQFDGVKYEYEYHADHLIEYVTIDTTNLTPEAYEYIYLDTVTEKELRQLSMKETTKNMLSQGFVEVTDKDE